MSGREQLVVSDASPVNYLLLIGAIDILPTLFEEVVLPSCVLRELGSSGASEIVRTWAGNLPPWCRVADAGRLNAASAEHLDLGESAAIALSISIGKQVILMDDAEGRQLAAELGIATLGTLGLLKRASQRGLIDLSASLKRLRLTNFRASRALFHFIENS